MRLSLPGRARVVSTRVHLSQDGLRYRIGGTISSETSSGVWVRGSNARDQEAKMEETENGKGAFLAGESKERKGHGRPCMAEGRSNYLSNLGVITTGGKTGQAGERTREPGKQKTETRRREKRRFNELWRGGTKNVVRKLVSRPKTHEGRPGKPGCVSITPYAWEGEGRA